MSSYAILVLSVNESLEFVFCVELLLKEIQKVLKKVYADPGMLADDVKESIFLLVN